MTVTVAGFLWFDPTYKHNSKYRYTIADVRLLRDMVKRHLTVPHEFVCITDDPMQFWGDAIRAVKIDPRLYVPGKMFQQLMPFHPKGAEMFGDRLVVMDLDCVVVGNLDRVVQKAGDLVLWRNPGRRPWDNPTGKGAHRPLYNGSLIMVRPSSRPDVWDGFDPETTPLRYKDSQDYISAAVGPDCAYVDDDDGVYRLAREDTPGSGIEPGKDLPANASVVFCAGSEHKPWFKYVQERWPWIRDHRK